jgi:4-aminobutyrate aminotransferase-like enzyme
VDGNRYVDLTAGFGVANVGHARINPQLLLDDPAKIPTIGN